MPVRMFFNTSHLTLWFHEFRHTKMVAHELLCRHKMGGVQLHQCEMCQHCAFTVPSRSILSLADKRGVSGGVCVVAEL